MFRLLLIVCGILEALCAGASLLLLDPEWTLGVANPVRAMAVLALAGGLCSMAAGLAHAANGRAWLLSLHGLALGGYGLLGLSPLTRAPLSFRPVALLFVLMALSLGAFAWRPAEARRGRLLPLLGLGALSLAAGFLAVALGWVGLGGPQSFWFTMAAHWSLCSGVLLALAWRAPGSAGEPLPAMRRPSPAR